MEKLHIGERTFEQLPGCTFGDYGGQGAVGKANISYLEQQFNDRCVRLWDSFYSNGSLKLQPGISEFENVDLIICEDDYSYESAYLATDCEEYNDITSALANYLCLDDEIVSEIETEWEDEVLPDIFRYDLPHALRKINKDVADMFEALHDAAPDNNWAIDLWYRAAEKANVYFVPEYNGGYWDTNSVAREFSRILAEEYSKKQCYVKNDNSGLVAFQDIEEPGYPFDYSFEQINEKLNYGTDADCRAILESIANSIQSGDI